MLPLGACSTTKHQNVTIDDFESIKMGLSQKKLEDKLGKAEVIVKDEAKISELVQKDFSKISKLSAEDPSRLTAFVGEDNLSELQEKMTKLTNGRKIEVFQYKLSNGDTENIYLINGTVVLKSFD